jgi:hypothetical protein
VLACPALELCIALEQKFERFGHDVGRCGFDELGIEIELLPNLVIDPHLQACSPFVESTRSYFSECVVN